MIYLSSRNIKFYQLLNLSILGVMTFIWLLFLIVNQSLITVLIGLIGITVFGLVNFFYLKLKEVALSEDKIFLEGLFSKNEYDRIEIDKIEETFLSPILYQILLRDSEKKFYFMPDELRAVKESAKLQSGVLLQKLNNDLKNT